MNVIENPKKREAFIKDLKALIAAKKALDEKEKRAADQDNQELVHIRWVSERFETLLREAREGVKGMVDAVRQIPDKAQNIRNFFEQPQNRWGLATLFINAGLAAIIGLMTAFLLLRPARYTTERMQTLPSRIAWGMLRVMLKAMPYLISSIVFGMLSSFRSSFSSGDRCLLLFFVLLLFYETTLEVFRVAFSPGASQRRVVSISDENAQYLWISIRRFALYAFFYFMVTRTAMGFHMPDPFLTFLITTLLIPFPIMLTVFVLQFARDLCVTAGRTEASEGAGETHGKWPIRFLRVFIRCWPILALGYVWAVFMPLILRYEQGFGFFLRGTLGTAVTLLATLGCLRGLDLVFSRFVKVSERIKDRFAGMEERTNRYLRLVRKGLIAIVIGMGIGIIGEAWGVPFFAFITSDAGGMIIVRSLAIALTLALVFGIIEITSGLSAFLLKGEHGGPKKEISQKQKTLIPVVRTAIHIAVGFVGGVIILDRIGVNTTPILAGAGILGLAVGLGSQTLVKDLINGLFILFEESIRVGDYATVGNHGGMVESVGLRTVKLRDLNGTVHMIPNSTIGALSNSSKLFSRSVMDIGIAYREDVDQVMEVIRELGEELQKDAEYSPDILGPLEILGLDRFEDSAVIIRARFKTKPLKQWGIRREFYRRLKRRFDERGIDISFPRLTLFMGEPKTEKACPMHIRVDDAQAGQGDTILR